MLAVAIAECFYKKLGKLMLKAAAKKPAVKKAVPATTAKPKKACLARESLAKTTSTLV